MTSTTINPNATGGSLGPGTVTGAASLQQALRDGVDTSYVSLGITHTGVDFPTPSIPAGAIVRSVTVNARIAGLIDILDHGPNIGHEGLIGPGTLINNVVGLGGIQNVTINWFAPKTIASYSVTTPDVSGISSWEVDLTKGHSGVFEDPGDMRVYKLSVTIVYVAKPSVTVALPTGTVSNTSFPLTTWDWSSDADGGPVNIAQVRVFTSAQYGIAGFNPATSPATAEATLPGGQSEAPHQWRSDTKLPNATYRSYVRVIQYGKSNWSNWAFSGWTQSVTPPADPSSVVATADSANGRISIDATASDTPRSIDAMNIQRSDDGGTTWERIRSFGADDYVGIPPVSGRVLAYDFEAPIGVSVMYRARSVHHYALGEDAVSDFVNSNSVTWTSGASWWIKHPTDWSLNLACVVRTQPSHTRARRQGIFAPMGRAAPIVVEDSVRTLPSGDIGVRTLTDATALSLTHLADSNSALLIQAPPNNSWPDRWVRLGDLTRERIVDGFTKPWNVDNFPWQEVERPEGDIATYPGGGPSGLTLPFTLSNTTLLH